MKSIKFLKSKEIRLDGAKYKPYMIGNLPNSFAFTYNAEDDKEGITKWFNYKGLTYVPV
jgi:hypothetical protein